MNVPNCTVKILPATYTDQIIYTGQIIYEVDCGQLLM